MNKRKTCSMDTAMHIITLYLRAARTLIKQVRNNKLSFQQRRDAAHGVIKCHEAAQRVRDEQRALCAMCHANVAPRTNTSKVQFTVPGPREMQ